MSDEKLFNDPDDYVVSKVQHAVHLAMKARENLEEASHEAIDAATTFGYELGAIDKVEEIIAWIEENRSGVEFEPGEVHYRDHFTSKDLIAFLRGEK
jgi:hypothetical protein